MGPRAKPQGDIAGRKLFIGNVRSGVRYGIFSIILRLDERKNDFGANISYSGSDFPHS